MPSECLLTLLELLSFAAFFMWFITKNYRAFSCALPHGLIKKWPSQHGPAADDSVRLLLNLSLPAAWRPDNSTGTMALRPSLTTGLPLSKDAYQRTLGVLLPAPAKEQAQLAILFSRPVLGITIPYPAEMSRVGAPKNGGCCTMVPRV